jgi:hypothetical protein
VTKGVKIRQIIRKRKKKTTTTMAFESSVTQQKGTQTVLDLGDKTSTFSKVLFKADKKDLDSRLHQICS